MTSDRTQAIRVLVPRANLTSFCPVHLPTHRSGPGCTEKGVHSQIRGIPNGQEHIPNILHQQSMESNARQVHTVSMKLMSGKYLDYFMAGLRRLARLDLLSRHRPLCTSENDQIFKCNHRLQPYTMKPIKIDTMDENCL